MADNRTIGAVAVLALTVAGCGTTADATKAGGSAPR